MEELEMKKLEKNKNNKGITLIALVVTIIILLILAGVTLVSLTGEKGLIKEARTAKELAEKAALEEQVELAIIKAEQKHRDPGLDDVIEEIKNNKVISNADQVNKETGAIRTDAGYEITGKLDDYIGKVSGGDGNTGGGDTPTPPTPTKPSTVEEAKNNGTVLDENNPTTITDKAGNKVVIPEGFKIASESGTEVAEGIVIEDVSAGNTITKGSQFVWIPVGDIKKSNGITKTIELNRYLFDNNGNPMAQGTNIINGSYEELATSSYGNETAIDIEAFKTSANTNHGYYIGRYEAGDPDVTGWRIKSSSVVTPMSCKENQYPYDYIAQPKAAEISRKMYEKPKKFTSDLINSYAWDTAIIFIREFSGDTNYAKQGSLQNTLAKTGQATDGNNRDVRCNIYDMAGNCNEWTTETKNSADNYNNGPCVYRGGQYNSSGSYPRDRFDFSTSSTHDAVAFRPLLYLEN